jgi:hypothetical protein
VENGAPPPGKRVATRPGKKGGPRALPNDPRREGLGGGGAGNGKRPNGARVNAGAGRGGAKPPAIALPADADTTGETTDVEAPEARDATGESARPLADVAAPTGDTVTAEAANDGLDSVTLEFADADDVEVVPRREALSGDSSIDHAPAPLDLVIVPATVPDEESPVVEPDVEVAPVSPAGSPTELLTTLPAVPEVVPATGYTDTDGTGGLPSLDHPKKPARALKPVVLPKRRPRVRRVTRVIRHVDTWSVFKVALVFNLFIYAVLLTAGVLVWQVAQNTGTVDNVQRFFESFGWKTFQLKGGEIYHNAWIAGLFLVVGATGIMVLAATLFNLITDLVGGIRVSVLEEEVVSREERGIGWRRSRKLAKVMERAEAMAAEEQATQPAAEADQAG